MKLFSEPTIDYCELAIDELIKRPYYALSNIAFFISAGLILVKGKGSLLSKQFAFITILVGAFSLIYDSTYLYGFQLLDLTGMLLLINFLLFLNLKIIFKNKASLIIYQVIATLFGLLLIIIFKGYSGDVIFGIFTLLYIFSEIYLLNKGRHTDYQKWLIALIIFIIGFVFWIFDTTKVYCTDFGLLNGRAIFHYLNAITIYYLYLYYSIQPKF